ncbi:MAG TPA: hypothetical protein VFU96_12005, partial [Acidimicrobiia bacterium]|nr:hypothetical protein [Acidimicrobiia bacterium]
NIDKTDTLTEFWSCTQFSRAAVTFRSCSGNINKADASAESWSCEFRFLGSTCTGNIDKTDTAPETWACEVADAIDFPETCSGDRTWLIPIVYIPFSI